MTKLEIIVRPEKLEDLRQALEDVGHSGLTVSEVLGSDQGQGHTTRFRGTVYQTPLVPKIKVELVVPTPMVRDAIWAVRNSCRTGEPGDGKIFLLDVLGAVRLRTGERDNQAL